MASFFLGLLRGRGRYLFQVQILITVRDKKNLMMHLNFYLLEYIIG